jgi:hypothetical protein
MEAQATTHATFPFVQAESITRLVQAQSIARLKPKDPTVRLVLA